MDGKYARLAARIRFNGDPCGTGWPVPTIYTSRVPHPRSLLFVPPSSDSYTSLDFLPCIVVHATQPYITRPSPLPIPLSLCVWPTLGLVYERIVVRVRGHQRGRGKRENENSSRVRTYTCLLVFNSKERSARME